MLISQGEWFDVYEQKATGKDSITLPKLRPEFESKYSFMYMNDVNEEPEHWGNWIYEINYDLEDVIGVPRSEWTEY